MSGKQTEGKQDAQTLPTFAEVQKVVTEAEAVDASLLDAYETGDKYRARIVAIITAATGADAAAFSATGDVRQKSATQLAALRRYGELLEGLQSAGIPQTLPYTTTDFLYGEFLEAGYEKDTTAQFIGLNLSPALVAAVANGELKKATTSAKRKRSQ